MDEVGEEDGEDKMQSFSGRLGLNHKLIVVYNLMLTDDRSIGTGQMELRGSSHARTQTNSKQQHCAAQ